MNRLTPRGKRAIREGYFSEDAPSMNKPRSMRPMVEARIDGSPQTVPRNPRKGRGRGPSQRRPDQTHQQISAQMAMARARRQAAEEAAGGSAPNKTNWWIVGGGTLAVLGIIYAVTR